MKKLFFWPLTVLAVATSCSRSPATSTRAVTVRYRFPETVRQGSSGQDYMAIVRGDIETDLSFSHRAF